MRLVMYKERKTATTEYSTEVIWEKRWNFLCTGNGELQGKIPLVSCQSSICQSVCLGSVLYIYTPVVYHLDLSWPVSISQILLLSL